MEARLPKREKAGNIRPKWQCQQTPDMLTSPAEEELSVKTRMKSFSIDPLTLIFCRFLPRMTVVSSLFGDNMRFPVDLSTERC